MLVKQLIYLDKDEITVGRMPTCDVVLESSIVPGMISRRHGRLIRTQVPGVAESVEQSWVLHDDKSLNGISVNGKPVGPEGQVLHAGDVVLFGRVILQPEFEFVFELEGAGTRISPREIADDRLHEHTRRIEELQKELEAVQQAQEMHQKNTTRSAAVYADSQVHAELMCCICKDWLVHAATLDCSHTFCTVCLDAWLHQKQFECPICRKEVVREPVSTRNLDAIVQKVVDQLPEDERKEYIDKVTAADENAEKSRRLQEELEKSLTEADREKGAFRDISSNWSRKHRELFHQGIKDYRGVSRGTYCRCAGLTEKWVHSADDSKLNQALHNLQLQSFVSQEEDAIRQRILMFIKYG